jgi:uncharacterized protein with PQ loop repeat
MLKTVLQALFGLALSVASIVVCFYLGLLVNGPSPDWRSAVVLLLLIVVTQWISFLAFRRRVALQVLFGLVLCMATAVWLIYSSHSFFWETQYPDGSNPITWRSRVVFLLLLAITQGISFLAFRRIRRVGHP